ncbi:ABC transporter ATP-binding protein [Cellulomonas carbonis]|uniref:Spermidine/putrescine import ATP-binding protein PotA n=1 Tax=Cellulomonas carbonis T26 TaxID=947969 RepID=A0A0A0BUH8_9CELL|nr:ABC transporter ATP-binding protein [Cellulomonas carbonis]KGM11337.1 spermidine/putrescine ABC transporter ATP-binding protein [Cellulomonas carbonis T26]GGB97758.1 polyamine-transporting ATPase [Cellulomonas carbonis]
MAAHGASTGTGPEAVAREDRVAPASPAEHSRSRRSGQPGRAAASGGDLVLERVTKTFGDFVAVDDLSLSVPAGSFFALLGPSGCGKTTTLRMVAGLERATSGRILLGGSDITATRAHQRPVNTVFQSYALFPHLDVLENVAFGLRRTKAPDAVPRARAALELVEMAHMADRRPSQLSGGQQQRVALARAVVNNPAVLLLDEPLGALDLKLRRQMQSELKRIQNEVGQTFVHVTHDQEEAMTMADTVAVMNAGRIEQQGPPEELYELPRTAFVANFLGRSNLLAGSVAEESGDALGVDVAGRRLWLPRDRAVTTSGPVLVGVRPEKVHIFFADEGVPDDSNVVGPGRVTDVAFTGVSTQYDVEVPGLGTLGVFAQNVFGGRPIREGDEVMLGWAVRHTFGLDGHEDARSGAQVEDDA